MIDTLIIYGSAENTGFEQSILTYFTRGLSLKGHRFQIVRLDDQTSYQAACIANYQEIVFICALEHGLPAKTLQVGLMRLVTLIQNESVADIANPAEALVITYSPESTWAIKRHYGNLMRQPQLTQLFAALKIKKQRWLNLGKIETKSQRQKSQFLEGFLLP